MDLANRAAAAASRTIDFCSEGAHMSTIVSVTRNGAHFRSWVLAWCAISLIGLSQPHVTFADVGSQGGQAGVTSILGPVGTGGDEGLEAGEANRYAAESHRSSPEAIIARAISRTAYQRLNAAQARRVSTEAFPALVNLPAAGPPNLPAGEHITGFPAANVASVSFASGAHAVLTSPQPLATVATNGRRSAIDLRLVNGPAGFRPVSPVVPIVIPHHESDGVQLATTGVSLAPLATNGTAAEGTEGAITGATVMYTNSARDTDTLVKATASGFDESSILRSVASPTRLSYRVGMPLEATLVRSPRSAALRVLDHGITLATIDAPIATDAEGARVPLTMTAIGDVMTVTIDTRAHGYRYPIMVDPTVADESSKTCFNSAWAFYNAAGPGFWQSECSLNHPFQTGTRNEWAYNYYITQGASRIYKYYTKVANENERDTATQIYVTSEQAKIEGKYEAGPTTLGYNVSENTLCVEVNCAIPSEAAMSGHEANGAFLEGEVLSEQPSEYGLRATAESTTVSIVQYRPPTPTWDTTSQIVREQSSLHEGPNALLAGGQWVTNPAKEGVPNLGRLSVEGSDPGIGIDRVEWKSPTEPKWQPSHFNGSKMESNSGPYPVGVCRGAQCGRCIGAHCSGEPAVATVLYGLPEGEDVVEAKVLDATGLSGTISTKVKIDNQAPYNITVAGVTPNANLSQSQREIHLFATATDGTGTTPAAGVASLALTVDGAALGAPSGSCSPGPCTATGEWTLNTESIGSGTHTLLVTATDAAGNQAASTEIPFTIHSASPVAFAPGKLNPVSGDFTMSNTDVSVTSGGLPLTVSRSVSSRHPASGEENGSLGAPWRLSVGGQQTIVGFPGNASLVFTNAEGARTVLSRESGGRRYKSPQGDNAVQVTLGKLGSEEALFLRSGQHTTTFTRPDLRQNTTWLPTTSSGTAGTSAMTFTYQVLELNKVWITRPLQALAPVPAGVSCSPTLNEGCRALNFTYAAATKAGEQPTEWGEYSGRLATVSFTAWDPAQHAMTTTPVAQYAYDAKGRLRAEWDPRITPSLKTLIGYDSESHVTSVQAPGQQPFLMTYGTTQSDSSGGRLLSVTRPAAATPVGTGIPPTNTAPPTLSTTSPVMGTVVSVSNGTWSNSALSYGYQWERCSATGTECAVIPGATNATYTPILPDNGHELFAYVLATNAGGTTSIASATSKPVPIASPVSTLTFGSAGAEAGHVTAPTATAVSSTGSIWVTDTGNNRLQEFTASGSFVEALGWGVTNGKAELQTCTATCQAGIAGSGPGQFNHPQGIAINPNSGNLYVVDTANNRIQELTGSGAPISSFNGKGSASGELESPQGIAIDTLGNDWITESGHNRVREFSGSGASLLTFGTTGTKLGQFETPTGVALASGAVYVIESGADRVQEFTTAGVAVREFAGAGSGKGQFTGAWGIATNPLNGDLYVTDLAGNRVEAFTPEGGFIEEFGGSTSFHGPAGLAFSPATGALFIADQANNRVDVWTPSGTMQEPVQAPPKLGTSAVGTIDYEVPVSGSGAPAALGSTEAAAWAQSDDPIEATALFPPDEPMGWPAKDYKRATVYYRDGQNRTVNVLKPGGGILTTEYNATNDVVRTLSAADRARALEAGSASAADSRLWDTESTYNSEGTEMLTTLGPEHNVQLPSGTQSQAREITHYFYDEGAPAEGGPYELVTKTTTGALVGSKEEDVRTTTTSYSGQSGLGWRLRKPTATIANPQGLKLVQSAAFDPSSGNVTETRLPGAGAPSETSGYTQIREIAVPATSVAVNVTNDVYVLAGNVHEYAPNGTAIRTMAAGQSSKSVAVDPQKGRVWEPSHTTRGYLHGLTEGGLGFEYDVVPTVEEEEFGESPTLFTEPYGIAADNEGNLFVTDISKDKVVKVAQEKLNGQLFHYVLVNQWGSAGTGQLQFKEPEGIAVGSEGNLFVADTGNNRIMEYSRTGTYEATIGSVGTEPGKLKAPHGLAADSEGHLWVADTGNNRVDEFTTGGKIIQSFGTVGTGEGALKEPRSVAVDSNNNVWVADTGNGRATEWAPNGTGYEGTGKASPHSTQTVYYSAEANVTVPGCGGHPEWAGLVCQTQPAKQPEGALPKLPVTVTTYNLWDEQETQTETVGTTIRTTTTGHDAAGRVTTVTITSTTGTALPAVTNEYSSLTGGLTKQSTTTEGHTLSISEVINSLGLLESYTDADGNTSTYKYDVDSRAESVSDGKGTQTYTYNTTSGLVSKLTDSAAGTFGESETLEGGVASLTYPNGMTATYSENRAGEDTGLQYVKTTNCTTNCTWYSETTVPSIHGQTASNTTPSTSTTNAFDPVGRLTQVQETPTGEGCVTRVYGYDLDSNRTSLTTRAPGTKGACAAEGGTSEVHGYDEADRLLDSGATFNAFGETASVPAIDAGGSVLTSAYYSNSQVATQTQNGETISSNLDPAGRTRETVATGKTNADVISHYVSGGEAPAWTIEPTSGNWTRYIKTPTGLAGEQTNGETPILQLSDLHGDIVATAELSPTATKLLSSGKRSTEYGVPTSTEPSKYAWLGGPQRATELASGVVAMGVRSYIPQLGRFLQTDPVEGGSANAYAYTHADPLDETDLSGATGESGGPPPWAIEAGARVEEEGVANRMAEEAAARLEAERKAAEARAAEAAQWKYFNSTTSGEEANAEDFYEQPTGGGGPMARIASDSGWICTLGGGVVAAGVGAMLVPGAQGAGAVVALAGAAFIAGCVVSQTNNPTYLSGLPHQSSEGTECINVFTISRKTHKRDHRSYACASYYA
jgi:RHS repeat-associated protein